MYVFFFKWNTGVIKMYTKKRKLVNKSYQKSPDFCFCRLYHQLRSHWIVCLSDFGCMYLPPLCSNHHNMYHLHRWMYMNHSTIGDQDTVQLLRLRTLKSKICEKDLMHDIRKYDIVNTRVFRFQDRLDICILMRSRNVI